MTTRTIHIWFADKSYWRITTTKPVHMILAEARSMGEVLKWEIEDEKEDKLCCSLNPA